MGEFREKIDFIKRQFISDNSDSYYEAGFCLLKTLKENDNKFIEEFLDSGVMMNILETINPSNQKFIFESLKVITEKGFVVKSCLINKAITCFKISDFNDFEEDATMALNIFFKLLSRELELNKKQGVLLIEKHAAKLLNFLNQATFELSSLLTAAKLFNFIVKYSSANFQETYFILIQDIYFQAMEYLLKMKDDSYLERIRTACCISFSIAKTCCEFEIIEDKLAKKISLTIREIAMKNVLPLLKSVEINIETAEDFIDFLELSIASKFYDNYELCFNLVENNYLKFLLNLSVFEPDRFAFRSKVCRLMSKIIVSLKNYFHFPLSDWEGGADAFQNFLSFGLEQLTPDSLKWEENLKISNKKSSSLLVLLYCHFMVTKERYIFTKTALAEQLMSFDAINERRVFLKVLWLLYAVSPVTGLLFDFLRATNKLTTILQRVGNIDVYYSHHESLLLFMMNNVSIPDVLRVQIIRLWIDQSTSNEEFNLLIKQCLDQGYNDFKIVKILMSLIHENAVKDIENAGKAFAALLESGRKMPIEVVEFILHTLIVDLRNHTSYNSKILEIVLKIAGNLPLELPITSDIVNDCVKGLISVTTKGDADVNLRSLLLPMCVFLIKQVLDRTNRKAAKIFLKEDFLKSVWNDIFNSENFTLIEAGFVILTNLLLFQEKLEIECGTMTLVRLKDLEKISHKLRMQNKSQISLVTFIKQLLLNNQLTSPLIGLHKRNEASHSKNILYIYYMIHLISNETDLEDQGEIYKCLSEILFYCFFQRISVTPFVTCAATLAIIENGIDRISRLAEPDYIFQDFAMTWLQHVKWATLHEELTLNPEAQQSVVLLTDLRSILLNMKRKEKFIDDFCSFVNNYLTFMCNYR